jgi:hypothetical protein
LKNKNYGRRLKIYATSAAGSVAVEGVEASAAGVLEGFIEDLTQKSRKLPTEK